MALTLSDELLNETVNLYLEDAVAKLSGGAAAISIGSDYHMGLRKDEGFFEGISDMIEDRDITSSAAQTPTALTSGEQTSVSYTWKTKLLEAGVSEVKRFAGTNNAQDALTMYFAKEYANAIIKQMYNIGLGAAYAAISNVTDLVNGDGSSVFDYSNLNSQLAKFGDASQSLGTLAMRGMQYHSLIGDASTAKAVDMVMGATINSGTPATYNRNTLVYDASTLIDTVNSYAYVLALVTNAIELNESESREVFFDKVGSNENITYQFKFEGGFDVKLKGYSYDGTGNTMAEIITPANWTKIADDKLTAGTLGIYSA